MYFGAQHILLNLFFQILSLSVITVVIPLGELIVKMTGADRRYGTTKTPVAFLKSIWGRPVVVKLNSDVEYPGLSL